MAGAVYACWDLIDNRHVCPVVESVREHGYPETWTCACGRVHYRLRPVIESDGVLNQAKIDPWTECEVTRE